MVLWNIDLLWKTMVKWIKLWYYGQKLWDYSEKYGLSIYEDKNMIDNQTY